MAHRDHRPEGESHNRLRSEVHPPRFEQDHYRREGGSHQSAHATPAWDYDKDDSARRDLTGRVGYGYGNRYSNAMRQGDPNAYSGGTAPYGFDPDSAFRDGQAPDYWGGHLGAEDRFDSGMTDRYGYGRGDFQDRDIYGRREYYSEGPEAEYQARARLRGQNNPPVGGYIHTSDPGYRGGPTPVSHRGRGPKGYERSDERILEEVCELLSQDPLIDASDMEVSCSGGVVTLTGTVDSRTKKYRAESLTADVRGVKDIQNDLTLAEGWAGGRGRTDLDVY